MSASGGADLLAAIVAATRRIVEVREEREPLSALARRAETQPSRTGRFRDALAGDGRHPVSKRMGARIIAECKRRSPSRGVLRADYDPVAIAQGYELAGAAALSVLTEPTFFDGSLEHLRAVRNAVNVPLLRKDFIVTEYQLLEARAAGADAVLLIVAALDHRLLKALHARAAGLGLDALVEVHTADELSIAVDSGAQMVGVNNRSLRTLEVDVTVSEALAERMPRHVIAVSESGLTSLSDLRRLQQLGYDAFLIGEKFMTATDPGAGLRTLLESAFTTKDATC
jgi:indole-3-glycerol phosphate synthase